MRRCARVSAVFLLLGSVWCAGLHVVDVDARDDARQRARTEKTRGVGTQKELAGEEEPGVKTLEPKVEPLEVFREVEKGWRSGTPKAFERFLRGKVRLDFGEGGPRGGLFTRGQAYYLLSDYLREGQTQEIHFLRMVDATKNNPRPYAMLERVYRQKNGVARREFVFVSLTYEGDVWLISEIRAIAAK